MPSPCITCSLPWSWVDSLMAQKQIDLLFIWLVIVPPPPPPGLASDAAWWPQHLCVWHNSVTDVQRLPAGLWSTLASCLERDWRNWGGGGLTISLCVQNYKLQIPVDSSAFWDKEAAWLSGELTKETARQARLWSHVPFNTRCAATINVLHNYTCDSGNYVQEEV